MWKIAAAPTCSGDTPTASKWSFQFVLPALPPHKPGVPGSESWQSLFQMYFTLLFLKHLATSLTLTHPTLKQWQQALPSHCPAFTRSKPSQMTCGSKCHPLPHTPSFLFPAWPLFSPPSLNLSCPLPETPSPAPSLLSIWELLLLLEDCSQMSPPLWKLLHPSQEQGYHPASHWCAGTHWPCAHLPAKDQEDLHGQG